MIVRAAALATAVCACSPQSSSKSQSNPPPPAAVTKEEAPPMAETLAFEIVEGDIQNLFFRRGPIATHVLATSGTNPRLIVAFPAGNTGIGLWFEPVAAPVHVAVQGALSGVERKDGMRGVSGLVTADTKQLTVHGAVLGSIRTLRDYHLLGKKPPETEHQVKAGPPLVLGRVTADGKHHIELSLEPKQGTTLAVQGDKVVLSSPTAIRVQATALADDEPLTPIPMQKLVKTAKPSERDLRALAFLSYKEKLLAGSWRFLTYFGRDTLLSVRLLLPVLDPEVAEAALGAVLERLASDGDVAHEEDIGDFAALRHLKDNPRPADLRQPIYDYKMIDDDFMLAPVLAAYLLDGAGAARASQFLARKTSAGQSYAAAVEKNLELVLHRTTPFADKPSATNLVALKPGIPVGEWRDSEMGLGGGRFAFDVNVALVPAALEAAARLYESPLLGSKADAAANARRIAKAWQSVASYFRVTVPADRAVARVKQYAATLGLDATAAVASIKQPITYAALSLDANGKPIEVMHSDDGFVLLFTNPGADYLAQVCERLTRPFPAGLRTPVGVVVANPAFAGDAKLRDQFTRGHYHGTVVWSWQQAMLAAGLARQLERKDLTDATKSALQGAQKALWDVIDATRAQRSGELWTWDVKDKQIVFAPFGQGHGHADESNAVQLWSTVYLGVQRP